MNAIDDSAHYEHEIQGMLLFQLNFTQLTKLQHQLTMTTEETPSLLTIIIDTNPHAWALLSPTLSLTKAVSNILVFINAHLAFSAANQVAVFASHSQRAVCLYPRSPAQDGTDTLMHDVSSLHMGKAKGSAPNNPNKYRPFSLIEHDLLLSLRELIDSTAPDDVSATTTTDIAGALTLALTYINKQTLIYAESGATAAASNTDGTANTDDNGPTGLMSRILVLSVSGDLAYQYIPIMNSVFASQRLWIPIDILKLAGDTVFLQQASDATKGTYMQVKDPRGLLQYLMIAFLPDQASRRSLVRPSMDVVDFRSACFCHQKVVEMGFVCSICLSIFCSPPEGAVCLICGTHLTLGDYGKKPAVVPRRKRKKRRVVNGDETPVTSSAVGTPAPA